MVYALIYFFPAIFYAWYRCVPQLARLVKRIFKSMLQFCPSDETRVPSWVCHWLIAVSSQNKS